MDEAKKPFKEFKDLEKVFSEKVKKLLTKARKLFTEKDSMQEQDWERKLSDINWQVIMLNADFRKLLKLHKETSRLLKECGREDQEEFKSIETGFDVVTCQYKQLKSFFETRQMVKVNVK